MEELLKDFFADLWWPLLAMVIVACLAVLGKSADWLVKESIALSERSGVPKVVIGATVVSLGTTMPEASVSVLAALGGKPGFALGNAVGSIICDTGLILGIVCLLFPLPLPPKIVNRQGWVQLISGVMLVAACWPWNAPLSAFAVGTTGRLHQWIGFVFLVLLTLYLWQSVRWSKELKDGASLEDLETAVASPISLIVSKLTFAIALVVGSSFLLVLAVSEAAARLSIPQEFIGATVIAFGTSLPELVTAFTAARQRHGDLAVGNIVGADILNVLFVAGAAAAATPGGLSVSSNFYRVLFPAMLFLLVVFRVGIFVSGDQLHRKFGFVLLGAYVVTISITIGDLIRAAGDAP